MSAHGGDPEQQLRRRNSARTAQGLRIQSAVQWSGRSEQTTLSSGPGPRRAQVVAHLHAAEHALAVARGLSVSGDDEARGRAKAAQIEIRAARAELDALDAKG